MRDAAEVDVTILRLISAVMTYLTRNYTTGVVMTKPLTNMIRTNAASMEPDKSVK